MEWGARLASTGLRMAVARSSDTSVSLGRLGVGSGALVDCEKVCLLSANAAM